MSKSVRVYPNVHMPDKCDKCSHLVIKSLFVFEGARWEIYHCSNCGKDYGGMIIGVEF